MNIPHRALLAVAALVCATQAQAQITLYGVRARLLGSNLSGATLGLWREACESADRARAAADTALLSDPTNNYAPDSLAFTLGEQAQCRLLAGDLAGAETIFVRQMALRDLMAARFADDMDFRYQRSIARGNLAGVMSLRGQHAPARQMLQAALTLAHEAVAMDPGNQAGAKRIDALEPIGASPPSTRWAPPRWCTKPGSACRSRTARAGTTAGTSWPWPAR